MRRRPFPPALVAACTVFLAASGTRTVAAGNIPSQVLDRSVYLDARALEELRATNPDHYTRATRILAAANHLCRPHLPEATLVEFRMEDFSCQAMLLLTSLPPQREIGFRLDHTRYIARVFVTDDPPRTIPAR